MKSIFTRTTKRAGFPRRRVSLYQHLKWHSKKKRKTQAGQQAASQSSPLSLPPWRFDVLYRNIDNCALTKVQGDHQTLSADDHHYTSQLNQRHLSINIDFHRTAFEHCNQGLRKADCPNR